jgi:hypothetical protein
VENSYRHRAGQFSIPRETVEREGLKLLPIFARCVVLECRYDWARMSYVYSGLSPDFDEIAMGEIMPHYRCEIREDRGKIVDVTFRRIECS